MSLSTNGNHNRAKAYKTRRDGGRQEKGKSIKQHNTVPWNNNSNINDGRKGRGRKKTKTLQLSISSCNDANKSEIEWKWKIGLGYDSISLSRYTTGMSAFDFIFIFFSLFCGDKFLYLDGNFSISWEMFWCKHTNGDFLVMAKELKIWLKFCVCGLFSWFSRWKFTYFNVT